MISSGKRATKYRSNITFARSVVTYYGEDVDRFAREYEAFGTIKIEYKRGSRVSTA